MNRGKFITFEGIEKCGKGTIIKEAETYLRNKGLEVVSGREPGGISFGEDIRNILLNSKYKGKICLLSELALFYASRAQYALDSVKPNLNQGKIFLSDRYYDSTFAYQGFGRIKDKFDRLDTLARIHDFNDLFTEGVHPNLTFIIDISIDEMFKRMNKQKEKKDRFEKEKKEFHERVREGYLWVSNQFKERCVLVNNERPIEETINEVKSHLDCLLEKYYKQ
jgi:dTMP kinase